MDKNQYKCDCGKAYVGRSGLRKHKLKCSLINVDYKLEDKDNEIDTLNKKLAQQVLAVKQIHVKVDDVSKEHIEISTQMVEIMKRMCQSNNCHETKSLENIHNKLAERCIILKAQLETWTSALEILKIPA